MSMHKMTNDIRLLQSLKRIEEPFGKNQIGHLLWHIREIYELKE